MSKFWSSPSLVTLLVVLTAALTPAWSQTTMGAVSGVLRDQSGAVIPNAAITLTNTATNIVANTKTNEVGFYIFPSVVPGSYTLSAQSAGMQKFEGALVVRVTERVVIDPVLSPGATTVAVEVRDITPLVSTDNPTVSATLELERIAQLPINGRSLGNLFNNLAGVEGTRFNGIFNDATEFVLDGAVMSERRWGEHFAALVHQRPPRPSLFRQGPGARLGAIHYVVHSVSDHCGRCRAAHAQRRGRSRVRFQPDMSLAPPGSIPSRPRSLTNS